MTDTDGSRGRNDTLRPQQTPTLSLLLTALAGDETRDRISVGDLMAAMGDRAFGPLMFVFAAPNLVPTPPGVSTLLGLPLIFLSLQLALRRKAWLPNFVTRRALARADFARIIDRLLPWLVRAEALLRPRLRSLARPPFEQVVGAVCLVLSVFITLPIPLANTLPSIAICVFGLGILGRDGAWIIPGFAIAIGAAVLVGSVYYAAITAFLLVATRYLG